MCMLMVGEGGQPAARVFYISLVFSNVRHVLSQCNTRLYHSVIHGLGFFIC